jgi:hypothetical protein
MRVGLHAGLEGAFACLNFVAEARLAYLGNQTTCMFLDEKEDTAAYPDRRRQYPERGNETRRVGGADLKDQSSARWRKSSRSSTQTDCVEVAFAGPAVAVRDSRNARGSVLAFPVGFLSTVNESRVSEV